MRIIGHKIIKTTTLSRRTGYYHGKMVKASSRLRCVFAEAENAMDCHLTSCLLARSKPGPPSCVWRRHQSFWIENIRSGDTTVKKKT